MPQHATLSIAVRQKKSPDNPLQAIGRNQAERGGAISQGHDALAPAMWLSVNILIVATDSRTGMGAEQTGISRVLELEQSFEPGPRQRQSAPDLREVSNCRVI
jgi:hypothetical protein